jgi:hypothetical protein
MTDVQIKRQNNLLFVMSHHRAAAGVTALLTTFQGLEAAAKAGLLLNGPDSPGLKYLFRSH